MLTSAFAYESWGWRVTGITEAAIKEISINDFKQPSGKLCRDHTVPRNKTYSKMLQKTSAMEFDKWWKLFWDNDKTILMTNNEHKLVDGSYKSKISKIHKLNWRLGYFQNNNLIG